MPVKEKFAKCFDYQETFSSRRFLAMQQSKER